MFSQDRHRDNAITLAHKIKQGLYDNIGAYIKCFIGVVPNAFLAKIAGDMQKPDGLTILEPDTMREQLFTLKLSDLTGIGRNMEPRLNRAGITSVEQLWNLSPKHARKIWGSLTNGIGTGLLMMSVSRATAARL